MILYARDLSFLFFFFNDTATTEIYTLSLPTLFRSRRDLRGLRHGDQRPPARAAASHHDVSAAPALVRGRRRADRKSTRLNSSHLVISYAVFCLKKKKKNRHTALPTRYLDTEQPQQP